MSGNVFLWLTSTLLIFWFYYRYTKVSGQLEQKEYETQQLQEKYNKLERTLIKRGQRLDVLLSTVSEVVLRVDRLGRVLGGNELAAKLFQFDKSPKLPQSILIFYRETEWTTQYLRAIRALPSQTDLPEMSIQGRIFLPRLAALGENEALLLCMDVTAHMQLQQKQKSLFENLMHDLKTPLTSLLGYARSIEAFADDAELRKEAVSVIAFEAKHINNLMNSMLTLNQIEYHKLSGTESCDAVAVCEQAWATFHNQMQSKNVALNMEVTSENVQVKMAEEDCLRIVMNIASNALKFAPSGSSIQCLIEEQKDNLSITIKDEGPGMPEVHLSRVTERFYRVDDVRGREKQEGHGLGLAIVKEILERDGGSLHLENRDSGGLSVTVELLKVNAE